MIRRNIIYINVFLMVLMIKTGFSQDYFEKKYPAYGGGVTFGYSYYFPDELNDYIDLTIPSTKKEHINTGIDVGLFLAFAPNKYLEIIPEFAYLYRRHSFKYIDLDLVVSCIQLGGTVYYIRMVKPGINLRFGGGVSNYRGNVSLEYPNSVQTWKGSTIGFHGAAGGELVLNSNMSVSLLLTGRYAKISQLKDKHGKKVPGANHTNLELNFSGIEIKVLLHYYF